MAEAIELALKFLPLDAAPMALIVTDGVMDYCPPMTYDGLSMRLCRQDVTVSCLLVDRIGATATGQIGTSVSGTRGGCETDRRGADDRPHGGGYAMARKFRIPDLNGLAHLVSVSGGCFFDLETLHGDVAGAMCDAVGVDGGSGGGGGNRAREAVEQDGRCAPADDSVKRAGRAGNGPSPALCQVGVFVIFFVKLLCISTAICTVLVL